MSLLSSFFQNLNHSISNNENGYFNHTTNFLVLLVILTITLYTWLLLKPKTQKNLPPGPSGLPVIGNLLSLDSELHSYFADLARTYGPVLKLRLASKLSIIVTSPSTAREVLKDNDIIFANRVVPIVGRIATYGGKDIVSASYGPEWRLLRKVCVLKMLSNTTLDSVYELRRTEVRKTVEFIYSRVGSKVNIGEQAFLTQMNVITNMMWGGAMEGVERERLGVEFRKMVAEMTTLLLKPNVSDFFPLLAPFDLQGIVKQMQKLVPKLDGIFEKMIKQRVKMEKEDGNERKDFLQFLLNLKEDEDSKTTLTLTQVKALLMAHKASLFLGTFYSLTPNFSLTLSTWAKPKASPRSFAAYASGVAKYGRNDIVSTSYVPKRQMLRKVCVLKVLNNTTLDLVYELRRTELYVIMNMVWRGGEIEKVERERMV
ncbi:hypothetical protein RIF29_34204 [Crotalaria pallida]|uniref:Cytochrome P450 n=1 Tax=Crotalaria pallida TaxID=3830 RepID=A0AAN9HR51_CROPI